MTNTNCEVCDAAPATTTVYVTPSLLTDPLLTARTCRFCAGAVEHRARLNGDGFRLERDEDDPQPVPPVDPDPIQDQDPPPVGPVPGYSYSGLRVADVHQHESRTGSWCASLVVPGRRPVHVTFDSHWPYSLTVWRGPWVCAVRDFSSAASVAAMILRGRS